MKKLFSVLIVLSLLLFSSNCLARVDLTGHREITISNTIVLNDVIKLKEILYEHRHAKEWTIELISPGGQTMAGIAMFNIIRELSEQGVTITTIVRSEADSMAAILFLAGDIRIIYEGAQVMFHEARQVNRLGVKITPPKGSNNERAINLLNDFFTQLMKKYFNNDEEKVRALLKKETRYSAKEMFDLGLATEYKNLID